MWQTTSNMMMKRPLGFFVSVLSVLLVVTTYHNVFLNWHVIQAKLGGRSLFESPHARIYSRDTASVKHFYRRYNISNKAPPLSWDTPSPVKAERPEVGSRDPKILIYGSDWPYRNESGSKPLQDKYGTFVFTSNRSAQIERLNATAIRMDNHLKTRLVLKHFQPLLNGSVPPEERLQLGNSVMEPTKTCKQTQPFLVILVLSVVYDRLERDAIRHTWGSAARGLHWPHFGPMSAEVGLVFVISRKRTKPSLDDVLKIEHEKWGDLLVLDLEEGYGKLTGKVLSGLSWVDANCQEVIYAAKIDQDTFLNTPLVVDFLLYHQPTLQNAVLGVMYEYSPARRKGKWAVPESLFPLKFFPRYCSGSGYIISRDAIPKLLATASKLRDFPIEDAYITGILAVLNGIKRFHSQQMPHMYEVPDRIREDNPPTVCEVVQRRLALTSLGPHIFDRIWLALQTGYCLTEDREGISLVH